MFRQPLLFIFASVMLACFALSGAAAAEGSSLEVSISPLKQAVSPGEIALYNISVKNGYDQAQNVEVGAFGEELGWITAPKPKPIEPGASEAFELALRPIEDAAPASFKYQVIVDSLDAKNKPVIETRVEKDITLQVAEVFDTKIDSVSPTKESYYFGEDVTVTAKIRNDGNAEVSGLRLDVEVSAGEETKEEFGIDVPAIAAGKDAVITRKLDINKYDHAGAYSINAKLVKEKDRISEASSSFMVEEPTTMGNIEVKTAPSMLVRKTVITMINRGVEAKSIEYAMPKPAITRIYEFYPLPEDRIGESGNEYVWTCGLAPGQSCEVSYETHYWKLYAMALVALLIVAALKMELEKPRIGKRGINRGETHTIHIDVRNAGGKDLTDVEIRDLVPNSVKIMPNFSIAPSKKLKRADGVELVWKFGKLSPKEERIISYDVQPALDIIGGLDLPPAEIWAKKHGSLKMVRSRRVRII